MWLSTFETLLLNVNSGYYFVFFRYIKPYWLVFAVNLASILYVYMFVHETIRPDPSAKLLSLRHYKSVWRLLSTGGSGGADEGGRPHGCRLWLYLLCFFVVVTVHFGSKDLLVLYELSSPLCWGSALVGYGSAALHLAYLSSLLGLRLLQRCLADSWVALLGLLSNVSGLVIFSVADTTALMFTGERTRVDVAVETEPSFIVLGVSYACRQVTLCVSSTWPPHRCSDQRCPKWWTLRSKVRRVGPSLSGVLGVSFLTLFSPGALFATVACVESSCSLVASGLFNSLYPATLHFMKGFSFLFAAIVLLLPGGIIGWVCSFLAGLVPFHQQIGYKHDVSLKVPAVYEAERGSQERLSSPIVEIILVR